MRAELWKFITLSAQQGKVHYSSKVRTGELACSKASENMSQTKIFQCGRPHRRETATLNKPAR
jgi:hypothetical protein